MKKRFLSILLVVCMLATMIPFMATAAAAEEMVASNVESTNADYAELYTQDGLVHAYMAFGTSDASYDIAGGVWYDLVGDANATINGGAYSDSNQNGWKVGEFGGLSYADAGFASSAKSITWSVGTEAGQLDLPETFNVEYLGSTTFRDVVMPYKATTVTRDGETNNYTVAVTKWNSNYGRLIITLKGTANTEYTFKVGKAADSLKDYTATTDANGVILWSTFHSGTTSYLVQSVDGLVVESAQHAPNANEYNAQEAFVFGSLYALVWSNLSGANSWGNGFGSVRWYAGNKGWNGNGYNNAQLVSEERSFVTLRDTAVAIDVLKTPVTLTAGESANYAVSYGSFSATFTSTDENSTKNGNSGTGLLTNSVFKIMHNLPGTAYALRIYDRALTAEEKALNHFVDIMAYTRYDISKYLDLSEDTQLALAASFADTPLTSVKLDNIDKEIARIEGTDAIDDTLYVQNGLVALFVADQSVDVANKVWYNMVAGGANATLTGSNFGINADGSLRINGNRYGTRYADGYVDNGSFGGTKNGQNYNVSDHYLNVGIDNLPDNDFTVSATASYDHIVWSDIRTGAPAIREGRVAYSEGGYRFMIGYFTSWNNLTGSYGTARLTYAGATSAWQGGYAWDSDRANFANKVGTGVYTETITRDEADDQLSASYKWYHGVTQQASWTFGQSSKNTAQSNYKADESAGKFILFQGWPASVYSVAVYDRVLSTGELQQNHAADLVEYYNIDTTMLLADESLKNLFVLAAQNYKIDPANYATVKADLEKLVEPQGVMNEYDELYVQDGLTALYTAYDFTDKSVDFGGGIWYNKLGANATMGAIATLRGPKYDASVANSWGWKLGANGGFHVSITKTVYDSYIAGKTTESGSYTGIVLDKNLIAGDEYTVESVLEHEYVMTASGDPFECSETASKYGVYNSQGAAYRLGSWNATCFWAKPAAGHNGSSWGQDRWFYFNGVYQSHNGNAYGSTWATYRSLIGIDDIYSLNIVHEMVPTSKTETVDDVETTVEFDASKITARYDIDAKVFAATATCEKLPEYGEFSWLNGIGGAVYAIRTYNRALTVAEMEQNHFVDIAAYHKIDLTEFNKLEDELKTQVYTNYANVRLNATAKANVEAYISVLSGGALDNTLYVTDGLVALFSSFAADEGGNVDIGAQSWINLVDPEKNAAIVGSTWKMNADGSFGYDMNWGTAVPKTDYFGKVWYDRDASTSNHNMSNHYVDFGIANLPADDFTVEWVSKYDKVGLTLADGSQVDYLLNAVNKYYYRVATVNADGSTTITGLASATEMANTDTVTYTLLGYGYAAQNSYINPSLGDAIGYLKTFASVGGRFEGNTNYCYRWYTTDGNGGWGASGYTRPTDQSGMWEDKDLNYSTVPGEIQTKAVTREKIYEGEVLTQVNYAILRNASQTAYMNYPVAATHTAGKTYPLGSETHFYLFKGQPVDMYAARVYNRVLSVEEQTQNRAADIVNFYDLDLTKFNAATALEQAEILSELADLGFESTKAQAQKIADAVPSVEANGMTQYDEAYVQDGLIGLYTAYELNETSLSIRNGVWANKVAGGEDAAIAGTEFWFRGEDGGLGFHLTLAQYQALAQNSGAKNAGISLPESFADLDEFTVESVAETFGLTNEDGTPFYNVRVNEYVDENGITVPATGATYGYFGTYAAGYRFGMINSLSWAAQYPGNSNALGFNRWYVSPYRYGAHNGNKNQTDIYAALGEEKTLLTYNYEAITMQFGKVTDADGNVTFTVGANGVTTLTGNVAADKLAALEALDPTVAPDKAGQFSLFNNVPSMVYAIRVYDRALTDAEKYQNHFVDIAAFFDLDLSKIAEGDEELLYASFEDVTFAADPTYVAGLYSFLTGDRMGMAENVASHKGYAPLLGTETGYRVLFGLNTEAVTLFENAGYSITYGAVVGVGEYGANSVNTVDGLTVNVADGNITTSASNAKVVVVGNNENPGVLYDAMAADTLYSVAITADPAQYSAGIIVRGFVVITDPTGASHVVYLDAADDADLKGSVSVLDAADYFVNEYDASVVNAYKYMNNASLLSILATCGLSARTVLAGDLALYVDAANGDDANNGLSADAAFATVSAAYAAAKAHLAAKGSAAVSINLAEGEYNVNSVLAFNAATFSVGEHNITIKGAGADKTTLTGAVEIDTSKATIDENTGLYVVDIPTVGGKYPNFRYVYANGEIFQNVHLGDAENYYTIGTPVVVDRVTDAGGNVTTEGSAKIYMPSDLFDGTSTYENTEVHITVEWNFNIVHVEYVDYNDVDANGDVAVYVDYDQYNNMAVYNTVAGRQYWLENSYDMIAATAANFGAESCYYYEESTGKLYIYDAEGNFATTEFSYAGLENIFTFESVSGLTIADMTITGVDNRYVTNDGGLKGGQAGGNGRIVNNDSGAVQISNGFLTLAAIYGNNVSNATFSGLKIENVAGDGINLRGAVENVNIVDNTFLHIGETAIRIGNSTRGETSIASGNYNKDVVIAGNYINGTGEFFKQCCGMLITNGTDIKIVGNSITNTTYTAISIGWKWNESSLTLDDIIKNDTFHLYNVEVAYNYITNFMTCMRDGGGIYILGGNAENTEASYFNFMHDNFMVVTEESGNHVAPKWFMGYYHDGAGSNWHDYNNVVVNATTTGVGNFVPYYVQQISGQLSHNVKLEGNYGLGFANATALYGNAARIDNDRNIIAEDYLYSDVAMNTAVAGSTCGDAKTQTPPSNAKTLVANIFATAGSALMPSNLKLNGGAPVAGGVANVKDYVTDGEFVGSDEIVGNLPAPTFTVNLLVDGKVVKTYNVAAGDALTIDIADPVKAADAQYTYTFTGWSGYTEGMPVYSHMSIEAGFEATVKTYTVIFMNGADTFYEVVVPYGTPVADIIAGIDEVPTKEADLYNTYTFNAWYTTADVATGLPANKQTVDSDETYYATYTETAIRYHFSLVVYNPVTEEYETIMTGSNTYNSQVQVRDPMKNYTYYVGNYQTAEEIAIVDQFVADYKPDDTDDIHYTYNMTVVVKEGGSENAFFVYRFNPGVTDYTLWNAYTDVDGTEFELVFDKNYRVNIAGAEDYYLEGSTIDLTEFADAEQEIASILVNGVAIDASEYTAYVVDGACDIEILYVEESEYAVGDLDGSGTINANDAGWLYEIIAGIRDVSTIFGAADLDGSGTINANDAGWIYEIIAGTRDPETLEPIA